MFAFAICGPDHAGRSCSRAIATASSRSTTAAGRHLPVCVRGEGASRAPGVSERVDTDGAAGVLHLPELLHRSDAARRASVCCRPAPAGRVDAAPAPSATPRDTGTSISRSPTTARTTRSIVEELERLFRQAVSDSWSATSTSAPILSGGMDSGSITAIASRPTLEHLKTFTCGFDLQLGLGPRAALRRARQGRGDVVPVQDRALRDGAQGRRHGARACRALTWHLEEPRVGQSYPEFLRRAARQQVRQGGAVRHRRRRALRRLSLALLPRRASTTTSSITSTSTTRFWQRLVHAPVSPGGLPADLARVQHVSHARHLPQCVPARRRGARRSPRTTSITRSTSRRKTFLHGLLVVEDKLSMAHGLETRVPFLDNDLVDFAMRVPVR